MSILPLRILTKHYFPRQMDALHTVGSPYKSKLVFQPFLRPVPWHMNNTSRSIIIKRVYFTLLNSHRALFSETTAPTAQNWFPILIWTCFYSRTYVLIPLFSYLAHVLVMSTSNLSKTPISRQKWMLYAYLWCNFDN